MELSMWMIADRLSKYSCTIDIKKGNRDLHNARFLSQADFISPGTVYVGAKNEFIDDQAYVGAIISSQTNTILVHTESQEDVFNEILTLFENCAFWEAEARRITLVGESLNDLLDAASTVVQKNIWIVERGGNVCARYLRNEYFEHIFYITGKGISIRAEQMGVISDKHIRYGNRNVFFVPELSLCCRHLYDGTHWVGDLMIETTGANMNCLRQYGEILGEQIDNWLTHNPNRSALMLNANAFHALLVPDMEEAVLEDFRSFLASLGWMGHRPKLLYVFDCDSIQTAQNIYDYMQVGIDHSVSTVIGSQVVLLHNPDAVLEEDLKKLVRIIQSTWKCRIGVSYAFFEIREIYQAYLQAQLSLENCEPGSISDISVSLPKYLTKTVRQVTSAKIEMKPLRDLRRYDEANQSALSETLFIYLLSERNQKQTADYFSVHRNTITYRLSKIQELTGIDLNDAATRVSLLLNYILLKDGALPEFPGASSGKTPE